MPMRSWQPCSRQTWSPDSWISLQYHDRSSASQAEITKTSVVVMSTLAEGFPPVCFINSTSAQQLMEDTVLLCNNLLSIRAKRSTIATRQTMLIIPLQGLTTTLLVAAEAESTMGGNFIMCRWYEQYKNSICNYIPSEPTELGQMANG